MKARAASYFGVAGLLLQAQARQIYDMASEPGKLGRHNMRCAALVALETMAPLGRKPRDDAALRQILMVVAVHAAPSALIPGGAECFLGPWERRLLQAQDRCTA